MTPQKLKFINSLLKLMKIDDDVFVIEAIDKMTSHISDNQYSDFIVKCSENTQYKRPLEIIKSVSDRYLDEIKSELFKDVEAQAKILEKKLERYFMQIEEYFRPSSDFYNPTHANTFESPTELIKKAVISTNDYWSDKDEYLVNKIGLRAIYDVFNDPYRQIWEMLAMEQKNILTKKYLSGGSKNMLESKNVTQRLEIKRIGK